VAEYFISIKRVDYEHDGKNPAFDGGQKSVGRLPVGPFARPDQDQRPGHSHQRANPAAGRAAQPAGRSVPPERIEELEEIGELNMALPIAGLGNFRISAFRQRSTYAAVIRFIPTRSPLSSLNVPPILADLIMEKRGLLLMVGSTGAGKSTTLASMMDHRNETTLGHILTIEDPVEFLFTNKKSVVNQREVGSDTQSLQVALKNALRQAPDVILIGEIRDRETMSAAIAYAQSGHLCLATMHANNSYQALNRILSFYPVEVRPPCWATWARPSRPSCRSACCARRTAAARRRWRSCSTPS
jgi:pilus retraction protein PilT